jgi:integrase
VLEAARDKAGQPTGLVVGTRNIDKAFAQFAHDVGLSWVTPHICRHTWACLAAQAGMPMFHIARMLGDTLKTVEDNYAHLAPDHLRHVADWRFAGKAA